MTTLTEARTAQLPRVNLLPPEIAAAAKLKRLKFLLGLLVLGAIVVSGLLFMWASGQVGQAQDELTQAEATGASLEAEVLSYQKVPEVLGELDMAQTNLVQAMEPEVRFSFYLNDLSLSIPNSTRLTSLTAVNASSVAQAGVTTQTVTVTPLGKPTIGTVEFQGIAKDYDSVAAWLQTLLRQKGYTEASVSSVALDEASELAVGKYYAFTTSTFMTDEAWSDRYEQVLKEGE